MNEVQIHAKRNKVGKVPFNTPLRISNESKEPPKDLLSIADVLRINGATGKPPLLQLVTQNFI